MVHGPGVDMMAERWDRWEGKEERGCHMRQSDSRSLFSEGDCAGG